MTVREGSSPHTRGAPILGSDVFGAVGIIPAYAGSTAFLMRISIELKDHPRIRGEHRLRVAERLLGYGSSPHTRGALITYLTLSFEKRIIPAYAGSTKGISMTKQALKDHPRIRGEHSTR